MAARDSFPERSGSTYQMKAYRPTATTTTTVTQIKTILPALRCLAGSAASAAAASASRSVPQRGQTSVAWLISFSHSGHLYMARGTRQIVSGEIIGTAACRRQLHLRTLQKAPDASVTG